ncbi:ScpA family protein [Arcanobacterium hippocoleae]|uniref:Segregation and condensation protein A n=1 Tax=Arcanobacterium hippocoleae TaxID=149017 RepID=A0ABU1T0A8_9ACTO|nr:ScpA family protein [Arcanobacterium hippocoleae]MDR6938787.1 segregation and condensation protein A [Arcanobacterium hippocoleae]
MAVTAHGSASAEAQNTQGDLFTHEPEDFAVELDVFSGPFDVLLSLIARKKLDVTSIALAQVTDEFISFALAQEDLNLSQASQFVVVAATLLDLKAARLLPHEEIDEEIIAILEARDLLFAKLLQYRAFKEVARDFAARLLSQSMAIARDVPLESHFKTALPELRINFDCEDLARLAANAFSRKPAVVGLDHLHDPLVPVESQINYLRQKMLPGEQISFAKLCASARNIPTVVSRFLAVLEMLRNNEIAIMQESPLAPLIITRLKLELDQDFAQLASKEE